eukprot:TRINITY_DN5595_c2_g1_i1.p1 TRINITY_DN5595_c2_g1~~TRINITY_DN5595_c2_g1_i1.p1  ORF type:complete len:757 (+),score=206.43 TRINITY_DN5595_c2_g1_i1:22-2271(+)
MAPDVQGSTEATSPTSPPQGGDDCTAEQPVADTTTTTTAAETASETPSAPPSGEAEPTEALQAKAASPKIGKSSLPPSASPQGGTAGLQSKKSFVFGRRKRIISYDQLSKGWFVPAEELKRREELAEEKRTEEAWEELSKNTDTLNTVLCEVRFVAALLAGVKRRRAIAAQLEGLGVTSTVSEAAISAPPTSQPSSTENVVESERVLAEHAFTPKVKKCLVEHAASRGYLVKSPDNPAKLSPKPSPGFAHLDPLAHCLGSAVESVDGGETDDLFSPKVASLSVTSMPLSDGSGVGDDRPHALPSALKARRAIVETVVPEDKEAEADVAQEFIDILSPEEIDHQKSLLQTLRASQRKKMEAQKSLMEDSDMSNTVASDMSPLNMTAKGLENRSGHNNCFLNSVLQVLWHCRVFRDNFLKDRDAHICGNKKKPQSCLYCAIFDLFEKFAQSEATALPSEMIRKILGYLFSNENRFQFGTMEDVVECFEAVLYQLHLTASDKVDSCAPPCFVHKTFSINAMDQRTCCDACDSERIPFLYSATVHYFPAGLFTGKCPKNMHTTCKSLENCMHLSLCAPPVTCPHTKKLSQLQRPFMLDMPDVFVMGVSWPDVTVSREQMSSFADMFPETLLLSDVFAIPGFGKETNDKKKRVINASLMGMCCYYGRHYTSYCIDDATGEWCHFDDSSVSAVGTLKEVRDQLKNGHQQPVLLLFSLTQSEKGVVIEETSNMTTKIGHASARAVSANSSGECSVM